jgi:hypothetical protein
LRRHSAAKPNPHQARYSVWKQVKFASAGNVCEVETRGRWRIDARSVKVCVGRKMSNARAFLSVGDRHGREREQEGSAQL